MTEVTLDIKQWGNNLGVRLPVAIARAAHLHVHQKVKIAVISEQIVATNLTRDIQQSQWVSDHKLTSLSGQWQGSHLVH